MQYFSSQAIAPEALIILYLDYCGSLKGCLGSLWRCHLVPDNSDTVTTSYFLLEVLNAMLKFRIASTTPQERKKQWFGFGDENTGAKQLAQNLILLSLQCENHDPKALDPSDCESTLLGK